MLLVNWNIRNAGKTAVESKLQWLATQDADILVMSEVNYRHLVQWKIGLREIDLHLIAAPTTNLSLRGSVIATRYPFKQLPDIFNHGTRDNAIVSAEIQSAIGKLELHSVYAPPDENRPQGQKLKAKILSSIPTTVKNRPLPQIVAGDFNTPQAETKDGDWISFSRKFSSPRQEWYFPNYRSNKEHHEFVDVSESAMSSPRNDMGCAFIAKKIASSPASSWRKYRLDHIIASKSIMPDKVWYSDDFPAGSDHRVMFARWS